MNAQINRVSLFIYTVTGALALTAWIGGAFFLAAVILILGTGVVRAQPTMGGRQLVLRGTPVMLMLGVMFVSASGMVFAVDQVSAFLAPETPTNCEAPADQNYDFAASVH